MIGFSLWHDRRFEPFEWRTALTQENIDAYVAMP